MKQGTSVAVLLLVILRRVAHMLAFRGVKGSSSRPLSMNLSLTRMRPASLVRSRRSIASWSSEPYTVLRSKNEVTVLICSRLSATPPKL